MKKILFTLAALVLIGAGCTSSPSSIQPQAVNEKPAVVPTTSEPDIEPESGGNNDIFANQAEPAPSEAPTKIEPTENTLMKIELCKADTGTHVNGVLFTECIDLFENFKKVNDAQAESRKNELQELINKARSEMNELSELEQKLIEEGRLRRTAVIATKSSALMRLLEEKIRVENNRKFAESNFFTVCLNNESRKDKIFNQLYKECLEE